MGSFFKSSFTNFPSSLDSLDYFVAPLSNLQLGINWWFSIIPSCCQWSSLFISEECKQTGRKSKSMKKLMF